MIITLPTVSCFIKKRVCVDADVREIPEDEMIVKYVIRSGVKF